MTDLLPCPFCGSKPRQYSRANHDATFAQHDVDHWVSCGPDGCLASVGMCETAEEATEMWNTRATGWQPIETAPRDGAQILMYGYYRSYPSEFTFKIQWWAHGINDWGSTSIAIIPTHWMPLPQPPIDD